MIPTATKKKGLIIHARPFPRALRDASLLYERWEEACHRHGSTKAALAALAALEKPAYQLKTRSRGALLLGMFRKPTKELDPVVSLYGYRAERRRGRQDPPKALQGG